MQAQADWSQVRAIAIDETSARRGRRYVTAILDAESHAVLFMAQGRDSHAVEAFCQSLRQHHGNPAAIRWVAMDMLHCYAKAAGKLSKCDPRL